MKITLLKETLVKKKKIAKEFVNVMFGQGLNPNMLGKDIQVGVACKGGDCVDESNRQRPPSKVRSKCPT